MKNSIRRHVGEIFFSIYLFINFNKLREKNQKILISFSIIYYICIYYFFYDYSFNIFSIFFKFSHLLQTLNLNMNENLYALSLSKLNMFKTEFCITGTRYPPFRKKWQNFNLPIKKHSFFFSLKMNLVFRMANFEKKNNY